MGIVENTTAQTGLVAHWMFDGNTADSSGSGLHGIAHNAVPTTGINGQPNTAYYFNGTNAYIGVPYKPQMNVSKYSIVTTMQVQGFYSGLCQMSIFLARGNQYIGSNPVNGTTPGSYGFSMMDNPYDLDCYFFDSTKFVFTGWGADSYNGVAADWQYPTNVPTIASHKWYRTVITYDSLIYKIYVNGQLINTVASTGAPIGASTDSINIGSNYDVTFIYPYWFNGLIDDMQLYNRVLSDTEVVSLGCSKFIALQPQDTTVFIGDNATYSIGGVNLLYQWQVDTGTGFDDITNATVYSGFNSPTLTVLNASLAMNNYTYRCLVTNEVDCRDTSATAKLTVNIPTSVNTFNSVPFTLFPNPSSGTFTVSGDAEYYIEVTDMTGRQVYCSEQLIKGVITLELNVAKGMYLLNFRDKNHRKIGVEKMMIE